MQIFIDESGSFACTTNEDSWSCVTAYMFPDSDEERVENTLLMLKKDAGVPAVNEVKLSALQECAYFRFLRDLSELSGCLFSVATDASFNTVESISWHQKHQVSNLEKNLDRFLYDEMKRNINFQAQQISNLSSQLYVQFVLQQELIYDVLNLGVLYFVQRKPRELSKFSWKFDQKDIVKTKFEDSFEIMLSSSLQSKTLRNPFLSLVDADYSAMKRFRFKDGEAPTYLSDEFGLELNYKNVLNLVKIIREDFSFLDSKDSVGIQIADLLASGVRRCLRGDFEDNCQAARLLGALMIQGRAHQTSLRLVTLAETQDLERDMLNSSMDIMSLSSRPILV